MPATIRLCGKRCCRQPHHRLLTLLLDPDVAWKEMAGMRDSVIHFYMGVDFEIVWKTVKDRYPSLETRIKQIFDELDE